MHNHKYHQGNIGGNVASFIAGAATATLAVGYFFYGPHGKAHRDQTQEWVKKAKKEVVERLQSAKEMTEETYSKIVDEVTKKYAEIKEVGEEKAEEIGADLKDRFEEIAATVSDFRKDMDKEMQKY